MNKLNHKWICILLNESVSCEWCRSNIPKKISVWRPSTILNLWWAWPFNVILLFFKSYCNAPLNSIKLRMCNLIYIILIPLIAGFTRFTLKSVNRFSFKSIQQNFMVFAESIKLLTFSEIFDSISTNHKIWFDIIQETCRKHHKHANNNLYATHNRLEHRRNSRRSFRNRNYKQQVQSLTLVKFRRHVTWGVTWPGSCIFTVQS